MSDVRRRPGGRSNRVREAVFRATLLVISESGLNSLTIADVAARADVHETTIYRRWRTTERLAVEALLDHSSTILNAPDTGSIHEDLVELGRSLVRYAAEPLGQALERTMAASTDDADSAIARSEFWEIRHKEVQILVERAKARDELPTHVESRRLIEIFISPIHFRLLLTREPVDDAYLDELARITIAGVSAHQPLPGNPSVGKH